MEARKQGQPSRPKLDPHVSLILGLMEEAPDITLAEIGERLAAKRGVAAAASTVWLFFDRRGITFKKRRRMPPSSSALMSSAAADQWVDITEFPTGSMFYAKPYQHSPIASSFRELIG